MKKFPFLEKSLIFFKEYNQTWDYYYFLFLFFISLWLLVFFRMKKVDFDYQYNEINKKIEKAYIVEKELKAKKAELLSVTRLGLLSKEYMLDRPKEDQIIIIPQVY